MIPLLTASNCVCVKLSCLALSKASVSAFVYLLAIEVDNSLSTPVALSTSVSIAVPNSVSACERVSSEY